MNKSHAPHTWPCAQRRHPGIEGEMSTIEQAFSLAAQRRLPRKGNATRRASISSATLPAPVQLRDEVHSDKALLAGS